MPDSSPDTASPKTDLRWLLLFSWLGFWGLMLAVGLREYADRGGQQVWRPVLDYGAAFIASTLIMLWQLWRARGLQHWLSQPWQWLKRLWLWLPLIAAVHLAVNFGLRALGYAALGADYRPGPWFNVIVYEALKFSIFYLLFSGVHYGLLAYRAWFDERLRTEHQARLTQQAQLTQLTQQLRPHFLFNALNTISQLIHADPDLADRLLTQLAELLRAATDASHQDEQTLDKELDLLRAYAALMTQRFADRVSINWQIESGLGACRVPTLSLQPLLENCFEHGVEKRIAPTSIRIAAARHGEALRIELEDDGSVAADPSTITQGVGLGNLRQRIAARHGDRAQLSVMRGPMGGYLVRLELPCAH